MYLILGPESTTGPLSRHSFFPRIKRLCTTRLGYASNLLGRSLSLKMTSDEWLPYVAHWLAVVHPLTIRRRLWISLERRMVSGPRILSCWFLTFHLALHIYLLYAYFQLPRRDLRRRVQCCSSPRVHHHQRYAFRSYYPGRPCPAALSVYCTVYAEAVAARVSQITKKETSPPKMTFIVVTKRCVFPLELPP